MSNRVVKLFAVMALTGGTAIAGTPRALKSGGPACGNVMAKSACTPVVAVKAAPAPAVTPRLLKTGAPAAGNVMESKGKAGGKRSHTRRAADEELEHS